jgi:spermidine synthase
MTGRVWFLVAYACSGAAALVYQVAWTRWLALHVGHSTAATSTVLAAFMGGVAIGSAAGGRVAFALSRARARVVYVQLELLVAALALAVPLMMMAARPILQWAYGDTGDGVLFGAARTVLCIVVLALPSAVMGATLPVAAQWFAKSARPAAGPVSALYAANTAGAGLGALGAGFAAIPTLGLWGTLIAGNILGLCAAVAAVLAGRADADATAHTGAGIATEERVDGARDANRATVSGRAKARKHADVRATRRPQAGAENAQVLSATAALAVLALTGFATFIYEVAWARTVAMIAGPSTYAFAATVTVVIAGLALGAVIATWLVSRAWAGPVAVGLALGLVAVAASWASGTAGGPLPRSLAADLAASVPAGDWFVVWQTLRAAALAFPLACALGVAFPLALTMTLPHDTTLTSRRVGVAYATNTLASVIGALAAGFLLIPRFGLEGTINLASGAMVAAVIAVAVGSTSKRARAWCATAAVAGALAIAVAPQWDRALLASGAYKYAPLVARGLDFEAVLEAGTLLYYREGAGSTVSVKRLTGTTSLSVDGKVDASTSGDMLTQKLLAHLPLLLHDAPRRVCIVGLGSGVTLASALTHPVEAVDVVELSPEVIEAADHFASVNRGALRDPRTQLLVGDARSHLSLSSRRYDVIVSEPSNPWIAGVATLFTREFFSFVRERLAPGGVFTQWAHTYDISNSDLRSIAATFGSVFPEGTMWLVGESDLLFVASAAPLEPQYSELAGRLTRAGVAADLAATGVTDAFALWSLFVGGPPELEQYGRGALVQTDNRLTFEFSAPRALHTRAAENVAALRQLLDHGRRPSIIQAALDSADAAQLRQRGTMFLRALLPADAYADFAAAARLDPADRATLDGLVQSASASGKQAAAESLLRELGAQPDTPPMAPHVALSRLLASQGDFARAISLVDASGVTPEADAMALEQLASIYSDAGDGAKLDQIVSRWRARYPDKPAAIYYAAGARFRAGELPAALALAQESSQAEPTRAATFNLLGAIHASMGQATPARDAFAKALQLDPRDSATYTNLGLLELEQANGQAARALFAEALSLDPSSVSARDGLSRAQGLLASR